MQNQPIQSERVYILKRSKTKHPRFHLFSLTFVHISNFNHTRFFRRVSSPRSCFSPVLKGAKNREDTSFPDFLPGRHQGKTCCQIRRKSRQEIRRKEKADRMANATQSDGERHIAGWLCRPVGRQARDDIDSQFSQHQQLFASMRAHFPIIFINFAIHINRIDNKVAALVLPNHRRL